MKMKLLLFVSVLVGSVGLSSLASNAAFAQSNESVPFSSPIVLLANTIELDPAEEATAEDPATSCAIDGIGWIVCPVVRTMAMLVDGAYLFVSSLLVVQPLLSTGAGPNVSVYNAWTMMRNIANVAFVIAFLIIIFSQLTSVGLNNYGIKKMLPRLIVAAILVNVSFWICAAAVDISNIAGSSLNSVMQGLAKTGDCSLSPTGSENCLSITMDKNRPDTTTGVGWAGISGLIIAGTGIAGIALYAMLSALLPALLAAVVAIITVFLVLTLRQALIILLVVISPLAFVAYLLPNTEQLFKKWKALFQTLLLMYPIIAMIFGASALASTIVMNSAPEGDYKVAIQVMGALISIIPLALTPIVMKTAGGVLNRFGGMVNNPNKGPIDKLRKGAEGIHKRQEGRRAIRELNGGRTMGFGKYKRAAKRERIEAGIESEKKRAANKYIAGQVMNSTGFANQAAGGLNTFGPSASPDAIERALSGAKFVVQQAELEEVKAESAKVEHMDGDALMRVINNVGDDGTPVENSQAKIAASIDRLVNVGSTKQIEEVANKFGTDDQKGNISIINRVLAESLSKNGPEFLKASDIDNIKRGTMATTKNRLDANGNAVMGTDGKPVQDAVNAFQHMTQQNLENGVMSQEKMVSASNDTLGYANSVATPIGKQRLTDTANELLNSEVLRGKIKHNAGVIETISKQMPTTVRSTNSQTTNITVNNPNPNLGRSTPPPNTGGYTQQGGLFVPHGSQPPQQPPSGPNPPNNP